jgi:hypothetical protein
MSPPVPAWRSGTALLSLHRNTDLVAAPEHTRFDSLQLEKQSYRLK